VFGRSGLPALCALCALATLLVSRDLKPQPLPPTDNAVAAPQDPVCAGARLPSRALTLTAALSRGLADHPGLTRAVLAALQAEAGVDQARGLFGTSLDSTLTALRRNQRIDTALVRGQSEETAYAQTLAVRRRLTLGTQLSLSLDGSWSSSVAPGWGAGPTTFRVEGEGCGPDTPEQCIVVMDQQSGSSRQVELGPHIQGRLALNVRQPLWRGAGEQRATGPLQVARAALAVAEQQRVLELERILAELEVAYWERVGAGVEVRQREAALRQAQQELARVEALREAGRQGGDDLSLGNARYAAAQRQAELSAVRTQARAAGRTLELAMGGRPGATCPVPVDLLQPPQPPGAPEQELQACLAANRSLELLRAQVEHARRQRRVAEDATRPTLDLDLTLAGSALGSSWSAAAEQLRRADNPEARAMVLFSLPLGDDPADAELRRASLGLQSRELEVVQLQRELARQVSEAVAALDDGFRQLELARQATALARRREEAAGARLAAGVGDNLVLLQAREDSLQAGLAEARQLLALVRARIQLDRLRGDLLGRHGPLLQTNGDGAASPAAP